jgi:hypothetical protein
MYQKVLDKRRNFMYNLTGNREQGTGNREQGTGNREQGTGNREHLTHFH